MDDTGKRIRKGAKFIDRGQRLSKENVTVIKKDCFTNHSVKYKNRKKVRVIKGRK